MNWHFGSCAKSTVSVESDPCEKEACAELRKKWQSLFELSTSEESLSSKE
jgi:hypothetical protein